MEFTFTNFVLLVEILLLGFGKGIQVREVPFHYQPRYRVHPKRAL